MSTYWTGKKVCVTGGSGFLGKAIVSKIVECGADDIFVPRSKDYDLTLPAAVKRLFDDAQPDVMIHLAAEVGGIGANQKRPGRFFYANMAMGLHLIEEARLRGVKKFVQVGTVCGYPKHCPTPFKEEDLFNGYPEETNAPYGVAKRALSVMIQAYAAEYGFNGVYLLPVNMYGPHDNFDLETSHVIPALVRKFETAVRDSKDVVSCWGTGNASREFLYVDDAADAIVKATETLDDPSPVNIGTGSEIKISDLANKIAKEVGFTGKIEWDHSKPDGQPQRQLDTTKAANAFGWNAKMGLDEGLKRTIEWWRAAQRD